MLNLKGNRRSRRYLSKILSNISKEKLNSLVKTPSSFIKYLAQFGIALTFSNSTIANPDGGVVVEGNATINNPTDTYMRVDQSSQKAVINWQDFSIDAGEHTHFAQPNASAITLNRVVTNIPSEIYGKLSANGQVMLINQNGILFGAGSQVDVSGLVASSADISNSDFMSDNFDFNQSGNADAEIKNDGNINIHNNGIAAMVAPRIVNNGVIQAHLGKISLAAGDKWVLDMGGEIKLSVEDPVAGYLIQKGQLSANGGKITLTANVVEDLVHSAINMSGAVEATSVGMKNGKIVLSANQGDVLVSGDLDASGVQDGQIGGEITVVGEQVGVYGDANLNANGDAGGGTILIGGDYQGSGDTPTTTNTFVGSDVTITANAKTDGDGGKVIVWADDTTQFHGAIEAKGGSISGDGGLVETSGKKTLALNGKVDASATNGEAGSWLLDPNNITVQDAGPDANVTASPNFTTTADSALVTTASIESALDGGTDVTLTTSAGGAQDGDITVNNDIEKTAGGDATLTLNAHNTIKIQSGADITSTSNKLNVTLNADSDNSGAGAILIDSGSVITSNGGNIYLGGGSDVLNDGAVGTATDVEGVELNNAQLISGAGNISIRGTGLSDASNSRRGVNIHSGSVIQSTAGTININGTGGAGTDAYYNHGVAIVNSSTTLTSVYGNISITGQGGGNASTSSRYHQGIYVNDGGTISSTGTGSNAATITLNGTGGTSYAYNLGIWFGTWTGASKGYVNSIDGDITLIGQAGGGFGGASAFGNKGIYFSGESEIHSNGTGANAATITLNGTGGNNGFSNEGVLLGDNSNAPTNSANINSVDGNILIIGVGGGDNSACCNYGIKIDGGAKVNSTGTGVYAATITLNGTGGSSDNFNAGIFMDDSDTFITSVDGNIKLNGTGGSNRLAGSSSNQGISFYQGNVISYGVGKDAATITLNGSGGFGDDANYGIWFNNSTLVQSVDGDINIIGTADTNNSGTGFENIGLYIEDGTVIQSKGTGADAATITITGTGTDGDYSNYGVVIKDNNTLITSEKGDIKINGTAGNSSGDDNTGIFIRNNADITSTGTGADASTITLNGTAGTGTNDNSGIIIRDSGTTVSTVDGHLYLIGTGNGSGINNNGVYIHTNSSITSSGGGDISVTGTATSSGIGNGVKISTGTNNIGGGSMTGNITLNTDDLNLADVTIQNTGSTTISSKTASTTIGVGTGASGTLQISDAELAFFNTGGFVFGNSSGSGKLSVKGDTWADDITLQSGTGEIALMGAQVLGANDFTVNGGSLTGGIDISANNISLDIDTSLNVGTLTSTNNTTIDFDGSSSPIFSKINAGGNITIDAKTLTGGQDISGADITLNFDEGFTLETLTSTGATTIDFDTKNGGSSSAVIGAISSGGDVNIRDGTGPNNNIQINGATNASGNSALFKADIITMLDTVTADFITLDATGYVQANLFTPNKLNLSAGSASLSGTINGGRGLRAALFGINTLNFTGGNSNYNFGSYKIGFDSTYISNRLQNFDNDFNSKYKNLRYSYLNLFDYDQLIIDKRDKK